MPPPEFELREPLFEQPKTIFALEHANSGTGHRLDYKISICI